MPSADITVLFSELTSTTDKFNAAKKIISDYNLPLRESDILIVFKRVRNDINSIKNIMRSDYIIKKYEFLFDALLNNNVNMFIALIKTYSDNIIDFDMNESWLSVYVHHDVHSIQNYIGQNRSYSCQQICELYKILLDHWDFSIDDLEIENVCKKKIQKYRDKIYSGKMTKVFINL